jgi:hypothetical protein
VKHIITATTIALVLTVPALLHAQGGSGSKGFTGTWKMNPAKSKFTGINAPKSLTTVVEEQEGGIKRHSEGTAADGSPIKYAYTAKYDGQDVPIEGAGAPSGADSIALKRIDERSTQAVWKKGGKVINTSHYSLSSDGKIWTVSSKGTGPDGRPTMAHVVLQRQ